MPSVGMRSRTRVFGARVLRSGRRLWSGPPEERHRGGADDGFDEDDGEIQLKENGWKPDIPSKRHQQQQVTVKQAEVTIMDIDATTEEPQLHKDVVHCRSIADKMCGLVYQRKRKRMDSKISKAGQCLDVEYQKYGKQYARRKWRKLSVELSWRCSERSWVLTFVTEFSSSNSISWFSYILSLILKYMRNGKPRMSKLSALFLSEPVSRVLSSHGIRCLKDSVSFRNRGVCSIFGSLLFTVNFLAVPFCFVYLQWSLILKHAWFPYVLVASVNVENDRMTEIVEHLPNSSTGSKALILEADDNDMITEMVEHLPNSSTGSEALILDAVDDDIARATITLHPSVRGSNLAGRTAQLRNGVSSRTIRKRRSSLKSRRVKKAPAFRGPRANGSLLSAFVSSKHGKPPLIPEAVNNRLRSSAPKKSAPRNRGLKSALLELKEDISSKTCTANILVVEQDSGFRIPRGLIKMEFSSLKQWFLAVKKDGIMLYGLTVRQAMRPCSNNRVTHDIIWRDEDNSWKLEFPDRQDWLVFKELYKECSNRNVKVPSSDEVPIPRVTQVSDYPENSGVPFMRPDSYISVKDDELTRVMMKKTAVYDMDNADEEWLGNFNDVSLVANEHSEPVKEETFELIIDAFEKARYRSSDDFSNETAVNLCTNLERKEVVEAVYSYWMKRRKQKRASLLRVFQLNQPSKRAQLLPNPVIRKKRSLHRRATRNGKVKQQNFMQAARLPEKPAKPTPEEQKALLLKAEETKAAASKSELLAIEKRQRVQRLMENADLATYKATMALRIAEAARVAEATVAAASFLH